MPPEPEPDFISQTINNDRTDGYWVQSILFHKHDKAPGVITSGLNSGIVEYLENPIANSEGKGLAEVNSAWPKYQIAKLDTPVAICIADITGNGLMDVIICHDYGPTMLDCRADAGRISWLENPGRDGLGKDWERHYIGRWPAMHRLSVGHFTQSSILELVAASIVRGPQDVVSPVPIIRFQSPDTTVVREALEWQRDIIDDKNFTVIHELTAKKFNGPQGLDSLLVSSREGTTHLWYDSPTDTWKREVLSAGEPRRPGQHADSGDHWGTGCADAGRIGDDPFAYVATLDPFHGTTCTVLTKTNVGISGTVGGWKTQILDEYGTPTQLRHHGDGPGHFVVCADFDGDGDDEFMLCLFGSLNRDEDGQVLPTDGGPNPNKGIILYKCLDLAKGVWTKWKISDGSSARIALGDFDATGRISLVSMAYSVNRYYEEPNPVVSLHLNNYGTPVPEVKAATITASVWDTEGIIYVSNPATENLDPEIYVAAPFIEVANYAISIEVLPKSYRLQVPPHTGIKVLYGAIKTGDTWRAPFTVPAFTASSTVIHSSFIDAHDKYGAVILRFQRTAAWKKGQQWATAQDVPVKTTLDVSKYGRVLKPLEYIKVEDTWWGSAFENVDFYNLTGFNFRFQGSQLQIAHMQFWTAGTDVNCGVHNHTDAIFQEIHVCLNPGTGNGGMARLKEECVPDPADPDVLNDLGADAFDLLVLKEMEEHGGMWERDPYGLPVRDEVSRVIEYPWHKWQAGGGDDGVDVWTALEFGVELDYRVEGIDKLEQPEAPGKKGLGKRRSKPNTITVGRGSHHGCC